MNAEKQKLWDNAKKNILQSRLKHHEHGIEPGILDTVIVLTLLGINIADSCEGHIKHDSVYPYVTCESEVDSQIYSQSEKDLKEKYNHIPKNTIEYKKFISSIEQDAISMKTKIQSLLDEFYAHTEYNPYNYEIVEVHTNRQFKLAPNVFKDTTQHQPAEYKKIIMEESRKKLGEFTEFLTQKFIAL